MTKAAAAGALAAAGRRFYARGWVMGTSGNFSIVRTRRPFTLVISASAVPKGTLTTKDFLDVDDRGAAIGRGQSRPSAETLLHVEIARRRGAAAILHTHSVWSTLLSQQYESEGGVEIDGLEMLKGLSGVTSHEHREWIPILPNDQDMTRLSARLADVLAAHPQCHAVLLAGHGMYTWGEDLAEAERHIEILEFVLEVTGRRMGSWH